VPSQPAPGSDTPTAMPRSVSSNSVGSLESPNDSGDLSSPTGAGGGLFDNNLPSKVCAWATGGGA